MQDHHQTLLLDRRPEGTEARLVEVVAVDGAADLDTLEAQAGHPLQLLDGEIHVL